MPWYALSGTQAELAELTTPSARWLQVSGEEEVPEGAVAVLTPDAPDVLSHVSVRARNMRVLFATCHDAQPLDEIRVSWDLRTMHHGAGQARGSKPRLGGGLARVECWSGWAGDSSCAC